MMTDPYFSLQDFPNSSLELFETTSPATGRYNCIAWALEETYGSIGSVSKNISIGPTIFPGRRLWMELPGCFKTRAMKFAKMRSWKRAFKK
ncbi:MAG: hypothetical protein AAB316_09020 [Bacteroidota bacterium]